MDKRVQPQWSIPKASDTIVLPKIKIFNSLSSKKEEFMPQDGMKINWYTCGPTVYDVSHMGHARTYIAFDILRRIMKDYFMFDVKYVLNITDVDDKIIKRSRQKYLVEKFEKDEKSLASLYTHISNAIRNMQAKSETDPDPLKRDYLKKEAERLTDLLASNSPVGTDAITCLMNGARDAISDELDKSLGDSITDHAIFGATAKQFETEYHADMKALNVLEPDVLVRVTEYIDPIISFIQGIIENGFGYVATSGSVYFDTNRFANHPRHFYAKLVPTAFGDEDQLATGEGELAVGGEKRSSNDFALWKSSKPGEPSWSSPWGPGRPGWHIECSVMASSVLGDSMDIHSGGVDLKFPHHDNELAQSEAYFGHSHWVRYFLHSGHLTISGCKMSKSLKNFVTIREALSRHSARRIRLIFLLHSWRDTLDYGPETMAEAISYEKVLIDFLYNATNLQLLAAKHPKPIQNSGTEPPISSKGLVNILVEVQQNIYDALCDSCDTPRAMRLLREFIGVADQYASLQVDTDLPLHDRAVQVYQSASFVLRLLRVFGVSELTVASSGSPVPVGAVTANGHVTALSNVTFNGNVDDVDQHNGDFLRHSWLSMNKPNVDSFADALFGALEATKKLITALLKEGDCFRDLALNLAKQLDTEFNLDLFNLPHSGIDCLNGAVRVLTGKMVSNYTESPFDLELNVWPILYRLFYQLVSARQSVRSSVLSGTIRDKSLVKRLMDACDQMRDNDLIRCGIRLQDRVAVGASSPNSMNDQVPCVGLVDSTILLAEMVLKRKREDERHEQKAQQSVAREEAGRQPASELFQKQLDKYSKFDDKGIPTHDASGKALSKTQLKKLQKLYDAQLKRHLTFSKANSSRDR